jgi:hypothetical protein
MQPVAWIVKGEMGKLENRNACVFGNPENNPISKPMSIVNHTDPVTFEY